jgi:hypothetical protein
MLNHCAADLKSTQSHALRDPVLQRVRDGITAEYNPEANSFQTNPNKTKQNWGGHGAWGYGKPDFFMTDPWRIVTKYNATNTMRVTRLSDAIT